MRAAATMAVALAPPALASGDPVQAWAGPCERVGARGEANAVAAGRRLLAAGRATGRLVSEKVGVAYRLNAERE